jgi:hypothetical protein
MTIQGENLITALCNTHTHTHIYIHIYMCVYIYIYIYIYNVQKVGQLSE